MFGKKRGISGEWLVFSARIIFKYIPFKLGLTLQNRVFITISAAA